MIANRRDDAMTHALLMSVERAERERDELIEALRIIFNMLDSGWLVRDTSGDRSVGWAMRQIEPTRQLAVAHAVLAKYPKAPT